VIAAAIYALWALTSALEAAIVFGMIRRRLTREYTWFFIYIASAITRSVAVFVLLRLLTHKIIAYGTYFYVFWGADMISVVLCLAVAYAVVRHLFSGFDVLRRYVSVAFGLALVALLFGSIVLSEVAHGDQKTLLSATLMLNRSLLFIQVGLVVMTCAFAAWAALPWRSDVNFGIALGFGVQASVELIAVTMRSELGSALNVTYQLLRSTAYLVAVLVWFLYIRAPQLQTQSVERPDTTDLELWNRTLAEMLTK
jgi:hypothetical protein